MVTMILHSHLMIAKGWFPLGVDWGRSALAPRIKLNEETKNFSRYACNLRLMETSLKLCSFGIVWQYSLDGCMLLVEMPSASITGISKVGLGSKIFWRNLQQVFRWYYFNKEM